MDKDKKRALRRHQEKRLKRKIYNQNYYAFRTRHFDGYLSYENLKHVVGKAFQTKTLCSCFLCKPHKYDNELSIQQKRYRDIEKNMLKEIA